MTEIKPSDILLKRSPVFSHTVKKWFRDNPNAGKGLSYFACESLIKEGYMMAYRKLKRNSI